MKLEGSVLPDQGLIAIALEDQFWLGVLSSRVHICWALAQGGTLEDRPRYNNSRCFETFPFPDPDGPTRERIRSLGEQLDAHRKRQQALHPGLTLTGMYNVLEKLRAIDRSSPVSPHPDPLPQGEGTAVDAPRSSEPATATAARGAIPPLPQGEGRGEGKGAVLPPTVPPPSLTPKEKEIHEHGLVSVLKQIHDDLDAAVFHAYGWDDLVRTRSTASQTSSNDSSDPLEQVPTRADRDEIILERLVALNHERAAEEKRGHVRWLRPEFQCRGRPEQAVQTELETSAETVAEAAPAKPVAKLPWPKPLSAQVDAVGRALAEAGSPVTAAELSAQFQRASKERIGEILETLAALGKATETEAGKFKG